MPYIISLCLIYFVPSSMSLLIPLPSLSLPPPSPISALIPSQHPPPCIPLFSLSLSLSLPLPLSGHLCVCYTVRRSPFSVSLFLWFLSVFLHCTPNPAWWFFLFSISVSGSLVCLFLVPPPGNRPGTLGKSPLRRETLGFVYLGTQGGSLVQDYTPSPSPLGGSHGLRQLGRNWK